MSPVRALPLVVALGLALAACAPMPDAQRLQDSLDPIAPLVVYDPGRPDPLPPMRANAEMVEDFLELGFFMESGRAIPQFSRFEGPVQIVTRGAMSETAARDLDRLLARLRSEARIDVTRARGNRVAEGENRIVVEFVPQRQLRAVVPSAACFVVPNVSDWEDFVENRRNPAIDWTRVALRERVAVFVPADSTPQETRDCLHEEIAQALGPLNDIFRLTDTVFNDDNFQTVLTGFDMLILRAWYAPELQVGMTRAQVAARLPAIINRLNPAGRRSPGPSAGLTPREWNTAIETALGAGGNLAQRREAASQALEFARAQGWTGPRLALSLMVNARVAAPGSGEAALAALLLAGEIYRSRPGGEVHAAHVDMQLAVQALAGAQYDMVLDLTGRARPLAERTENAALLSSLDLMRAEALAQMGRTAEAERLRLDSMAAARYGFGSEAAALARQAEIARLAGAGMRMAQR
ncbi:MAG: DUF2927 domain-containing protein [Pararhodobacter sp.]